jgi:hypothetical protein
LQLSREIGVNHDTAWKIKHELLQVMLEQQRKEKLSGRIELDDAHLGGERPGKRGRGSEDKIPFLAAVETRDEKPVRMQLRRVRGFRNPKSPAAFERVSPGAARSSPTDWAVSPAWLTQAAGTLP